MMLQLLELIARGFDPPYSYLNLALQCNCPPSLIILISLITVSCCWMVAQGNSYFCFVIFAVWVLQSYLHTVANQMKWAVFFFIKLLDNSVHFIYNFSMVLWELTCVNEGLFQLQYTENDMGAPSFSLYLLKVREKNITPLFFGTDHRLE